MRSLLKKIMLKFSKISLTIALLLSLIILSFIFNKAFPALDYLKSHLHLENTKLYNLGYGAPPDSYLGFTMKSKINTLSSIATNLNQDLKLDSSLSSSPSSLTISSVEKSVDKIEAEEAYINEARRESALKLKPPSIEEKLVSWFFNKTEMDSDIEREIAAKNSNFSYINFTNLQKTPAPVFNKYDLASFYTQQKKLMHMQKVASHIAKNYDVKLNTAEKIVLSVYANANTYALDPNLLFAVIQSESTFKPEVVSPMKAQGLMQVITKYHTNELKTIEAKNLDIHSIDGNIELGTMVLKKYIIKNKGNVERALQMYNGSFDDKTKKYSKTIFRYSENFTSLSKSSNIKGL